MPYSGASDPDLPANVKKMPASKRSQWVEVFNSSIKAGDDESTAFAKANGVAKKKALDLYDDEWNSKQLDPWSAKYVPFSTTAGEGCANCHWFSSPDGCWLVWGDISPTGYCKLWMENAYLAAMADMEASLPEVKSMGIVDRIKALLKWHKEGAPSAEPTGPGEAPAPMSPAVQSSMQFNSMPDGRLRWFTTFTNVFKDRQGEIITEEAHREYVNWANETKSYPDLHLWHAGPESKWGQADFVDFVDGFVVASGLVDEGKEYIAKALEGQEVTTSHGFHALAVKNVIHRYRTFEISPLPAWAAANSWTDFQVGLKEAEMPFSDARRQWLKTTAGKTDEQITEWEQKLAGLSEALKAQGIEWKSEETPDIFGEFPTIIKSITDLVGVVAEVKTALVKANEAAEAQAAKITELEAKVTQANKSLDERVEQAFTAAITKAPGFKATETESNVVDKKDPKSGWFEDVVLKGLTPNTGG